jgi:hypothetical protein
MIGLLMTIAIYAVAYIPPHGDLDVMIWDLCLLSIFGPVLSSWWKKLQPPK